MAISFRPCLRQRRETEAYRSPGSCFIARTRAQVPDSPGRPGCPPRLTQASQHDANGAEVGKSTQGVCREDFCSDLELQRMSEEGLPQTRWEHPTPPGSLDFTSPTCSVCFFKIYFY